MIKFKDILKEEVYKSKNKKEIPNGKFCWSDDIVCDFFDDGECELNYGKLTKTRDGILKAKKCLRVHGE